MENCKGCVWLDTTRPPKALGYCMNPDVKIPPGEKARYEVMPRCKYYKATARKEVVKNG